MEMIIIGNWLRKLEKLESNTVNAGLPKMNDYKLWVSQGFLDSMTLCGHWKGKYRFEQRWDDYFVG